MRLDRARRDPPWQGGAWQNSVWQNSVWQDGTWPAGVRPKGVRHDGFRTEDLWHDGARPADARDARHDAARLDDAAGPIVRPYTVSNGRTRPTADLGSHVAVAATGSPPLGLGPEHRQLVDMCVAPQPVAELADRLRLPVAVAKVLVGDLLDCGALTVPAPACRDDTELALLEAVLAGLRRAL